MKMAANLQRRHTNKLVLCSLLLLMLVIGVTGPMLQTLDDDENLGMTFLEANIAGHHEFGRGPYFSSPATSMIVNPFQSIAPVEPFVGTLELRLSAKFAPAVLAIPLRT
jgi:hypothetical protein